MMPVRASSRPTASNPKVKVINRRAGIWLADHQGSTTGSINAKPTLKMANAPAAIPKPRVRATTTLSVRDVSRSGAPQANPAAAPARVGSATKRHRAGHMTGRCAENSIPSPKPKIANHSELTTFLPLGDDSRPRQGPGRRECRAIMNRQCSLAMAACGDCARRRGNYEPHKSFRCAYKSEGGCFGGSEGDRCGNASGVSAPACTPGSREYP